MVPVADLVVDLAAQAVWVPAVDSAAWEGFGERLPATWQLDQSILRADVIHPSDSPLQCCPVVGGLRELQSLRRAKATVLGKFARFQESGE